jgi:single-strand DNA-binding protein
MNLNKVFLIGRLTRDPEIKNLPSGKMVCQVGLATDRFFTNKEGKKQQETEFHNIVLFGRLAEIASQYLKKGSLLFIEGRLRTRNWQDNSGNKKSRTEIIAERIQLGPRVQKEVLPPIEGKEEIPIVEEEEINIDDIPF